MFNVVPNLVVDIEIVNVCLFVYLFVGPHVLLILQKGNGPIMIPKTALKSRLLRGK